MTNSLLPEVPGYRLLEPLGAGGMGHVYTALQLRLQRLVAIKFLHPSFGENATPPRESLVLAQVAHPHIVSVFDSGVSGGREYLVLEYLPNGSLRDRLDGHPWRVARAMPVLTAIAEALTAIHLKGLLHLDLKPENVLYDEHGEVKLTDFGLARTQGDTRGHANLASIPVSLDYAPPEQRLGLAVDARADLFSLAVIAYELLTGRLPGRVFRAATDFNARLHPDVDDALRRGLARHPEERPPHVLAFLRDLTLALRRWRWWLWPWR